MDEKDREIAELKARLDAIEQRQSNSPAAPRQDPPSAPSEAQSEESASVGRGLAVGIFLLPWIFAWFLLRKGHSTASRVVGFAWLGLCLLGVIGLLVGASVPNSTASSSTSAPIDPLISVRPADEAAFVAAIEEARLAYAQAKNDLAKGGTRGQRKAAICAALSGAIASEWTGRIAELGSNSEGKGVLTIDLGNGTTVRTWNNAISDIGSETLIESSTPLFRSLSALNKGDEVKFSGEFFSDDVDCVREMSFVSLDHSMTRPEFLMRFSRVMPLSATPSRPIKSADPTQPPAQPDPSPALPFSRRAAPIDGPPAGHAAPSSRPISADSYLCAHGDQEDARTIAACDRKDLTAARGEPQQ